MSKDLNLNALFWELCPEIRSGVDGEISRLLPSITVVQSFETFGMVVLEAQFSGLPAITSARGGSQSIIHNETGFAFAEKDHAARYMTALLTDDGPLISLCSKLQIPGTSSHRER